MKPGSILTAVLAACALSCTVLPLAWSADSPAGNVTANVVALSGEVKAGTRLLKPGDGIVEGEEIVTGRGGYATFEFTDRSVVRMMSDTRLGIESYRAPSAQAGAGTALRLGAGAIEANVPARREPGFTVVSMAGSISARGARFRARGGEALLIEVLEGLVMVAGAGGAQVAVKAGEGAGVRPNQAPLAPVSLLRAPDVSRVNALQERPVVRLRFAPVAGAQRYRVIAAPDRDLRNVLVENIQRRPDVRMVDLRDGEYFFGVRAIDAFGLEGEEARGRFRLKARPLPPVALAPEPGAPVAPGSVSFSWAAADDAVAYRFQLASDEGFAALIVNRDALIARELVVDNLEAGTYYWRIASDRAGGDQGPFGDPRALTLQAPAAQTQTQ